MAVATQEVSALCVPLRFSRLRPGKTWSRPGENRTCPKAGARRSSIVMTPPPGNGHNLIAARVHKTLVRGIPDDWEIFQTTGVSIPTRSSLFNPDLVVITGDRVPADDEPAPFRRHARKSRSRSPRRGNPDTDRRTKLWGYAHAEVPVYLSSRSERVSVRFGQVSRW